MRKILTLTALVGLLAAAAGVQGQGKLERTEAEKKAIARIRQLGGLVLELAQNDPRLEVSFPSTDGKFTEEHLIPLKELKGLVHLNLRGHPVTDEHLTDLTRLHLEKTKITDKGLEHLKGLTNLEYLNLYGTEITDAGLVHLEGMKKLKNLYLWQTKVTETGAARLKQVLPQVDINLGFDAAKPVEEKNDKPKEEKKEAKKDQDNKEKEKPKKKEKKDMAKEKKDMAKEKK